MDERQVVVHVVGETQGYPPVLADLKVPRRRPRSGAVPIRHSSATEIVEPERRNGAFHRVRAHRAAPAGVMEAFSPTNIERWWHEGRTRSLDGRLLCACGTRRVVPRALGPLLPSRVDLSYITGDSRPTSTKCKSVESKARQRSHLRVTGESSACSNWMESDTWPTAQATITTRRLPQRRYCLGLGAPRGLMAGSILMAPPILMARSMRKEDGMGRGRQCITGGAAHHSWTPGLLAKRGALPSRPWRGQSHPATAVARSSRSPRRRTLCPMGDNMGANMRAIVLGRSGRCDRGLRLVIGGYGS